MHQCQRPHRMSSKICLRFRKIENLSKNNVNKMKYIWTTLGLKSDELMSVCVDLICWNLDQPLYLSIKINGCVDFNISVKTQVLIVIFFPQIFFCLLKSNGCVNFHSLLINDLSPFPAVLKPNKDDRNTLSV